MRVIRKGEDTEKNKYGCYFSNDIILNRVYL